MSSTSSNTKGQLSNRRKALVIACGIAAVWLHTAAVTQNTGKEGTADAPKQQTSQTANTKPSTTTPAVRVAKPRTAKPEPIRPMIPDADRHQPGKVFLEHADQLNLDQKESGGEYQVLRGNVVFRKDDMFMYCDSAYFYDSSNSIDAFGNVRMEQGDTLFVYGNELNYNGPDEFATLFGTPVRMINRDVKLVTDVFYYDLADNYGFYDVGGVLTDKKNRLESIRGEYYPDTKNADFYDKVELRSLGDDDTLWMYTDILHYNTLTHIAEISAPTRIIGKDGHIVSTSGTYNTETGLGDLYDRSTVYTNRGNTLTADTLIYDRTAGRGEGFGNVVLTDSARNSSLHGMYGYYDEVIDSAFVTGRAMAKEYGSGRDTLYLHGDTINAYYLITDSIRVTNAFHGVRFYRNDMQGICDSLSMCEVDSMMRMYYSPVIWNGDRQIYGNLIEVHANDSTADVAYLPDFGFMTEHIGEDCYNQLSGNKMTAWFNDSTLRRLYVEGNVMAIMFPMETDSTYNKYATAESSFMDAYFTGNAVDTIKMWPETTGRVTPLYLAKRNSYFLARFKWLGRFRPDSPQSIFEVITDDSGLLTPVPTGNKPTPPPAQTIQAASAKAAPAQEATTKGEPVTAIATQTVAEGEPPTEGQGESLTEGEDETPAEGETLMEVSGDTLQQQPTPQESEDNNE